MEAKSNKESTTEEEDLLERSKWREKGATGLGTSTSTGTDKTTDDDAVKEKCRSYRDFVLESGRWRTLMGENIDEGEISDDDIIEESTGGTWVGIGMTREEKIKARRLG